MKTILSIAALIFFVATSSTCLAELTIANVSKEDAKQLGIEVRAKPNGPDQASIELEFKPVGNLADFKQVSLEISDGDKLLLGSTPLKDQRLDSGNVIVRVMGNRDFLQKVTLRIICGTLAGIGDDVRIKDLVDLKHLP